MQSDEKLALKDGPELCRSAFQEMLYHSVQVSLVCEAFLLNVPTHDPGHVQESKKSFWRLKS